MTAPLAPPGWVDETSYSRDYAGQEPKTWCLRVTDDLRITVTRHIAYPPNVWLLYCPALNLPHTPLASGDLDKACAQAVGMVRHRLARWLSALDKRAGSRP